MADYATDYEDVTAYVLDPADELKLLDLQKECVFMWTTKTGEPVGVVHSFIAIDGKLWMTAAEQRKRITALRRDPRSCVCINSAGTALGDGKSITYKCSTIIHVANDYALKK
jgi:hypothetical protein